jgi:anti-sigma factor (TIGR02949 family)
MGGALFNRANPSAGDGRRPWEGDAMECAEVTDRLWEYLDGELAAEEAAAIRGHVAGCPHCNSHCCCDRAFLAMLVTVFKRNDRMPSELRTRVLARLARSHLRP